MLPNFQENDSEKEQPKTIPIIIWALLVALVAWFIRYLFFWEKPVEKEIYKYELWKLYAVDPKTFAKWIRFFCADIIQLEHYKGARKIKKSIADKIIERLGKPTAETPVLRKAGINEKEGGSYEVLRETIKLHSERCGIDPKVFKQLSVFPPKIATQIKAQYGKA
jgi:hypothetical protein